MELSLQHSSVDDNSLATVASVCVPGAVYIPPAHDADHIHGFLADCHLPLLDHLLQTLGSERKDFSTK